MSTTIPITSGAKLAELAVAHPGASSVFRRHGLDYSCAGRTKLADACAAGGLDPEQLIAEIGAAAPEDSFVRWDEAAIEELVTHLLERFHESHRAEVPRLIEAARHVEQEHEDKPACPRGLREHLERMLVELDLHMQKEEQILFPLIRAGRGRMASMPVQMMEQEHREHSGNLLEMRRLAHGFEAPQEACETWRGLYAGLAELEALLMQHIHLENNVLFPRALRGEA